MHERLYMDESGEPNVARERLKIPVQPDTQYLSRQHAGQQLTVPVAYPLFDFPLKPCYLGNGWRAYWSPKVAEHVPLRHTLPRRKLLRRKHTCQLHAEGGSPLVSWLGCLWSVPLRFVLAVSVHPPRFLVRACVALSASSCACIGSAALRRKRS